MGKVGTAKCRTMTLSSAWLRRNADPLSNGQRWYCPVRERRYKTTMGVLVEFRINNVLSYAMADFPPHAMQQTKWSAVQRRFGAAGSALDLLHLIPEAAVVDSGILTALPDFPGCYAYDEEALLKAAPFDWNTLLREEFLPETAEAMVR